MDVFKWLIENKIAQNEFSAAASRAMLYRKWRPKTDKKNEIPSWQAFQLAIAGIDPDDVEPRQIDMFDMSEPATPADDSARFHGHQEGTAV